MDTKSASKIYLIEKCPPLFTTAGPHGFFSRFPPTGEDIILQYHGYHNYFQEVKKGIVSIKDATNLVVEDVINWWLKTGIPLMVKAGLKNNSVKLINQFLYLKKKRGNNTEHFIKRQSDFLENIQHTFWVIKPSYEKFIS